MSHVKKIIGRTRKGRPVYAIAGGSGEPPPAQGGDTVTIPNSNEGQQQQQTQQTGEHAGETPPATPASTYSVDPGAFNRGAQEAPGQAPAPQQTQQPSSNGRTFTEDDIARARQEEKEKLYGRIDEMSTELKALREAREAEQKEREAEEERKRNEAKKAEEEGLDTRELLERRLSEKEQEWSERFNAVQTQAEQAQALLEKERQFNMLQERKAELLSEHEDDIMPHLRDLVGGDSEEEILASIDRAKQKTEAIMNDVTAATQQQRQAVPTTRATLPGGPGGPVDSTEQSQRTLTAQDIRGMSMADYAQVRDQLRQAAAQQGPYGTAQQ